MFKPNIVVLAAAGAMLAACRYNGYKINGNSHNLDNGDTVYITRCLDTGQHIDTAIVHEGRFTAEGTVDSTVFCLVYCPKQPKLTMPFFLEHGTIRMRLSDRPAQAYVSGTANNDKWQSLMAETVSIGIRIDLLAKQIYNDDLSHEERVEIADSIATLNAKFGKVVADRTKKESGNDFGKFLLLYYSNFIPAQTIKEIIATMPEETRRQPDIKRLNNECSNEKHK